MPLGIEFCPMPERPELDYVVPRLHAALAGRAIRGVAAPHPVLLRVMVPENPEQALFGRTILAVQRRAHFVRFLLDGEVELAIAPMLAGRFRLCSAAEKRSKDTGFVLAFDNGGELRYRDDVDMGKVYLYPPSQLDQVPGLAKIGVDVLGPDFTLEALRGLLKGKREQIKVFLLDKSALDALGNAYADEALFAAGLHPKARAGGLSEPQIAALHAAIRDTLRSACEEVERRAPPLDEKVRDFLSVRNRKGKPCPRCGTTIRTVGVHGHDAFFCPQCQPDEAGKGFVDWRKV